MRAKILTLTTDFGADGPYVAALKGVVLGLAPEARIVDISHAVTPQNIREGAFVLSSVLDAFLTGTVHLAVVDPGVGTERRLIAVAAGGHWFLAPDNGLIPAVIGDQVPDEIHVLSNPSLQRVPVSSTFHGRDILAPAAAHLLLDRDPNELGPRTSNLVPCESRVPRREGATWRGEVVFRDRFGNLITNVAVKQLAEVPPESWVVEIAGRRIVGLARTYGDWPTGTLLALPGSSGWVEITEVNGDAARRLAAAPGTPVQFRPRRSTVPLL